MNEWDALRTTDWWPFLEPEFHKPYWAALWARINAEPRARVLPREGEVCGRMFEQIRRLEISNTADHIRRDVVG
jgi:hypothetical protein